MDSISFIQALKNGGTDLSARFNVNALRGVHGMSVTHQTGFGNAWRKGIHPDNVDVDTMNGETHVRMLAAVAGATGGKALLSEDSDWAKLLGVAAAGYSIWQAKELFLDWKAGFEAAKHIGPWYADRMSTKLTFNPRLLS